MNPLRLVALTALILALPGLAAATQIRALSFADMMGRADRVVLVRAGEIETRYDRRGRIVRDQQLEVLEVVHGDAGVGDTFALTMLGGSLGDLSLRIEGEPELRPGERYVVFARRWEDEVHTRWRPVGMNQGVLSVQGERVLPGGHGLVDDQGRPASAALEAPTALDALLEELRRLAP